MSLTENCINLLAGPYDLPVFIGAWFWATARFIASGGQPDTLLATGKGNVCRFSPYPRLPCVKGAGKNL